METIQVTNKLVIEVHAGGGPGDEARLTIKALDARAGAEAGGVTVYPSELAALRGALAEAAARLVALEPGDQDDVEISLGEAVDLFGLDYAVLAQAAYRGELAARRSGLSWLTTRWAVRQALAEGRLRPG